MSGAPSAGEGTQKCRFYQDVGCNSGLLPPRHVVTLTTRFKGPHVCVIVSTPENIGSAAFPKMRFTVSQTTKSIPIRLEYKHETTPAALLRFTHYYGYNGRSAAPRHRGV